MTRNLTHVVSQRDVLQDGVETFSIDKMPDRISQMGKDAKGRLGTAVGSLWEGKQKDGNQSIAMEEVPEGNPPKPKPISPDTPPYSSDEEGDVIHVEVEEEEEEF